MELAGSTGLSPQTISNVVRRLLDDGIVREDRTIVSGPGKPRTVLELEGNRMVAIGIHLDPSVLTFVMMNLRGEVIRERRIDVPHSSASKTIELMATTVKELIAEVRIPKKHIVGVGIAVPGPVNVEDGVVLNPPLLDGWADVDIVAPLRKMLRLQVIIEKDTIASAVGELWQSKEEKTEDFVFVYCGHGFGAGIVFDSDVYRAPATTPEKSGITPPDTSRCSATNAAPMTAWQRAPHMSMWPRRPRNAGWICPTAMIWARNSVPRA